uniref:procollagen-proline 4-dioxygenase n=1 Tax=Heterorhabditis bacteriophora TaxID=37862 RepID=A0A1I7XB31_HETBA
MWIMQVDDMLSTFDRLLIKKTRSRSVDRLCLAEQYEQRNEASIDSGVTDITNPINAFLMIKRKIFDWRGIEEQMSTNKAQSFIERISNANYGVRYPTEEDLTGAAIGLLRLQDTYRLDAKDLADGKIYRDQGNYTFSAKDCFEIARAAYNDQDYYHTIIWMEEAKRRLENEDEPSADMADVAFPYSFSAYFFPKNFSQIHLSSCLQYLQNSFSVLFNIQILDPSHLLVMSVPSVFWEMRRELSMKRCAEMKFLSLITNPKNTCSYIFLNLKLARATVHDAESGKLVTATYRISKSAWLKSWEHEVVERVNQRIDLMTNLEMETAEELQIANYGIGGHYDPHFDHARKEESKSFDTLGTGNRIATVLFYMSQPQHGGGTVFTDVRSTVMPIKNDALFWYNLHRQGDGDSRTRHAACPVLVGVKWIHS